MPYIITTKRPCWTCEGGGCTFAVYGQLDTYEDCEPCGGSGERRVSRRAVATLEEARLYAYAQVAAQRPDTADWSKWMAETTLLPESGGTVGPLPDGTVIEVTQVTWPDLCRYMDPLTPHAAVIDAFNAREAKR